MKGWALALFLGMLAVPAQAETVTSVTQFAYDTAGRQTCMTVRMNPAAFGSAPGACALGAQGVDGPDRITYTEYDAANRVIKVTSGYLAPAGYASRVEKTVTYTDNGLEQTVADGKVTGTADGRGNLTTYEYDGFDRLVKVRYPNASGTGSSTTDYEQYGYDPAGNRTSWRRRDGATVAFTYDALNRAENGLRGEAYGYDNLGRRTLASLGGSWVSTVFDALGRVSAESANSQQTRYQYDLAGSRTRITWPDEFHVTYAYDAAGAMTGVFQGDGTQIAAYGYDDLGRRSQGWAGPGSAVVWRSYGYDAASRLSSLSHDLPGTGRDQTWTFGYNAAGQVKTRAAANPAYDWASAQTSKTYVLNGLNQVVTAAGTTLQYADGRGNLTNDGTKAYGYDLANNLTSAASAALTYDAAGRLNRVTDGALVTGFIYAGDQMIGEIDANGVYRRRHIPGPGVDEPVAWYEGSGASDRRWLSADYQGSIVSAVNSANQVTLNSYDEYGIPAGGNLGRFQYTGQAWLPEVGLYHYKARAYSPTLGRFLQTDPSGYDDGLNWYAYVGNDPVNKSDPTGLCPECRYQTEEERASVSEMSDGDRIDYYKAQGGAYATMTSLAFAPEMMLLRGAAGVGRGGWALVNESMSARALAFQVSQGGRAGQAFVLNGVKFDGMIGKSLMDAKSSMAQFVGKDGAFKPWFKGGSSFVDQARRQLTAAGKTPVVWRVQDAKTATAIGKVLDGAGVKGINIQVAKPVCTAFVGC